MDNDYLNYCLFPGMPGVQLTPMFFTQLASFDGKRMRRSVQRKTVDYNAPIFQYIEVILVIILYRCGY